MKQSCVLINISYILSRRVLLFKVGDGPCINWVSVKLKKKFLLARRETELKKTQNIQFITNNSKLKKEKDVHKSFIIDELIIYLLETKKLTLHH